jgi:hypothetical protein
VESSRPTLPLRLSSALQSELQIHPNRPATHRARPSACPGLSPNDIGLLSIDAIQRLSRAGDVNPPVTCRYRSAKVAAGAHQGGTGRLTSTARLISRNKCHTTSAMHLQHKIPFKRWFLRTHRRTGEQRSPTKQPTRLPPAIGRFSDPNCAALRHSTESLFAATVTAARTTPTNSPPRQLILLIAQCDKSRGSGGWPPASLPRSPQNLWPFFKISQQPKLRVLCVLCVLCV